MTSSTALELVAGVLRRDHRILLCHRRADREHYPDVWDLPGGHIEPGETTEQALVRELGEELGVEVDPPSGAPWAVLEEGHLRLRVFIVDRWRGEPTNRASEEHSEIRWVGDHELGELRLAHSSYAALLRSSLRG